MKYIITIKRFVDIEVEAETAKKAFNKISKLMEVMIKKKFAKFIQKEANEQKKKN